MRWRPSFLASLLVVVHITGSASPSVAAEPPNAPRSNEALEQAHTHFMRAKEHYRKGEYRESVRELETAYALDPTGAELVYNLAVVHEKLGTIDDAIRYLKRYELMNIPDAERERARASIKRLEGARRTSPPVTPKPDSPRPPLPPSKPRRGKLDGWTWAAGALGFSGVAVGTTFGVLALAGQPESNPRTSSVRSYQSVQDEASATSTRAAVSDIAFGVGAAGAVTAVLLYALRFDHPEARVGLQINGTALSFGGQFK